LVTDYISGHEARRRQTGTKLRDLREEEKLKSPRRLLSMLKKVRHPHFLLVQLSQDSQKHLVYS
jgi:hypothetical protein